MATNNQSRAAGDRKEKSIQRAKRSPQPQPAKPGIEPRAVPQAPWPATIQRALAEPSAALRPADVLALQRAVGNRAVSRMIAERTHRPQSAGRASRHPIQAKLTVGPAGDAYEQEADRAADQVLRMPDPADGEPIHHSDGPVQRQPAEEDEELRRQPLGPAEADGSFEAGGAFESRLASTRGSGHPLPAAVRDDMEPRLGVDFEQVRVHSDSEAVQLNREIGAQAFTHGADIYFGAGKFNPGTTEGRRLLAHELTHVTQQGAAGPGMARGKRAGQISRRHAAGIQRKELNAKDVVSALRGISFVKQKLDQGLKLRRDEKQDAAAESMRAHVEAVLAQYETNLKASNDQTASHALLVATVLEAVARVIAVNELNDPELTPQLAVKLFELYESEIRGKLKKMDQRDDALQLARALISDDPVALYMHYELPLDEAARRVRKMAWLGSKEPADMFRLLRQRFEIELATLTKQGVQGREDIAGSYNVKESTGEISSRYFQDLFGDVAQPAWTTNAKNATQLQFAAEAGKRLDDLEKEVAAQKQAKSTDVADRAGLTFKQSKHLHQIEQEEAKLDRLGLNGKVDAALADLFKVEPFNASWIRQTVADRLEKLPLTVTVQGMHWFGSKVPTAAKGETVYATGASRRKEASFADLFGKKKAAGSIKHLGEWEKPEYLAQDRGKNYNRFRRWKDKLMTGGLGFSDVELPAFGAANINWQAFSSLSAGDQDYGVNAYGDTHFLVDKAKVRDRIVYTATDHGQPRRNVFLAFADFLLGGEGLTRLKDVKLVKVIKHVVNSLLNKQPVATGTQPFEVQIFGKFDVATDVEKIYVAPALAAKAKQNVQQFSQNTGIPYQFIEKPKEAIEAENWFAAPSMKGTTSGNLGQTLTEQVQAELETIRSQEFDDYMRQRRETDEI